LTPEEWNEEDLKKIEKLKRWAKMISEGSSDISSEDDSIMAEWENIHNKVIFDSFNEILDNYRPYGIKGPPLPWSINRRTLTYKYSEEDWIDEIFHEAREKILGWGASECGTLSNSFKVA